ncbi:VOC family protein [Marinomonas algarum]|uniref:VOC family protein n=1 Tax=Marinomonas algarum TaxID=2883105 RepID=A0A9X1IL03_9GAMM|nr:VOC family protein [Marinomonas algarum]MCB5160847.1 VOC family protein [Marinomonas algarum]
MFSHIMLGANDLDASQTFYDATFQALGYKKGMIDNKGRYINKTDSGLFMITKPLNGEPATHGNGSTIGFSAATPEIADAWHKAGLENGGTRCEDDPGVRDLGRMKLYLAYLKDPSGNKICVLCPINE